MSNRKINQAPKTTLTVLRKELISKDMIRIWFDWNSDALLSYANEGDYFKLMFATATNEPILRTFTLARVNEDQQQVAIDFVLHGTPTQSPDEQRGGYAHWFAHTARVGDQLSVLGPNRKKSVIEGYDCTLFIADATAIPALESILRKQPTKGHLISISSITSLNSLSAAIQQLNVDAITGIWCAGEYQIIRTARALASELWNFSLTQQYFSSYWKRGLTENGHKALKQTQVNSTKSGG